MDKIVLEIGGRKVYWNVTADISALLAQSLVSSIGPADGEEE